ncbi:MAG TPA: vitamin K epoxide reductase family protein, partial [Myxococcota bacterium]|nr:vitamin K epoxide reductase family protein [Myxococcota bacterium]
MFKSRKVLTLVLLGLCLVGLADSAYLTWDHGSHKADPVGFEGGLCGADGGCAVSRSSPLSELPLPGTPLDLPISLLALGFYVVFMVLVALDHRSRPEVSGPSVTSRLLFALALLSVVYSGVLLGYSLYVGSLCKFCVVLYVVNLGLLWATWSTIGEAFGRFVASVWGAVFSRPALVAAIAMATVVGSGYLVYRGAVSSARAETEARMRAGASQVSETDRPMKGPANAKVQIVEYADFECPHCEIAFSTLEALVKDRPEVSVQFKHFPLDQACNPLIDRPFHQRACELAALTEC